MPSLLSLFNNPRLVVVVSFVQNLKGIPDAFNLVRKEKSSHINYHNDPKFLDRQVWANSADPDQTAPRFSLFAIPFASS